MKLALFAAIALLAQDPAERIARAIEAFEDEKVEVREKAEADLVAIGPPAVEALRRAAASDKPETKARAQHALRAIKVKHGLWEIDPVEAAKKAFPKLQLSGEELLLSEARELASEALKARLPASRVVILTYTAREDRTLDNVVIVDIDGGVTPVQEFSGPAPSGPTRSPP